MFAKIAQHFRNMISVDNMDQYVARSPFWNQHPVLYGMMVGTIKMRWYSFVGFGILLIWLIIKSS